MSSVVCKNKDYRALIEDLREQGFVVELTERGHWRATPPNQNKRLVVFSESADPHALLNTRRKLMDQGFIYPTPSKAESRAARRKETEDAAESAPPPATRTVSTAVMPGAHGSPPSPPASSEEKVFADLKEAKELDKLAAEHVATCEKTLAEWQGRVEAAKRDRVQTIAELKRCKAAFDAHFEASA